jgi:hypothetical protein
MAALEPVVVGARGGGSTHLRFKCDACRWQGAKVKLPVTRAQWAALCAEAQAHLDEYP